MFGGRIFQQTVGIPMNTNYINNPSRRFVPLFVRDRLHTEVSEEKRKVARPIL